MAATQFQFRKAARHAVKLKIGVDGASGSGKTMGALAIAQGITNGAQFAVADSENGSASLYADRFAFDTLTIPDANPATYRAIIDAAVAAGYPALVIDSLSHAWLCVLQKKEQYDRANPKSNSWTNWGKFAPEWEQLMAHILQAPIHIVATMRSKQAYEQVESGGKKQVVKLGLQPQVRDGAEYEFGLVFSVNQAHRAEATKDRTGLFTDAEGNARMVDLCARELHRELVTWMGTGGAAPAPARPQLVPETPPAFCGLCGGVGSPLNAAGLCAECAPNVEKEQQLLAAQSLLLKGKPDSWQVNGVGFGGKPMGTVPDSALKQARHAFVEFAKNDKRAWIPEQIAAITLVLDERLRAAGQEALALDGAAGAGSGGTVAMPKPGKIADALPAPHQGDVEAVAGAAAAASAAEGGEAAARPTAATSSSGNSSPTSASSSGSSSASDGAPTTSDDPAAIRAANERIAQLMQHQHLPVDTKNDARRRLNAGNPLPLVQLQQMIHDLEFAIENGF